METIFNFLKKLTASGILITMMPIANLYSQNVVNMEKPGESNSTFPNFNSPGAYAFAESKKLQKAME
jgi:hypothetical protein